MHTTHNLRRGLPLAIGAGIVALGMSAKARRRHHHGDHGGHGQHGHGLRHGGHGWRAGHPWGDPERFREHIEQRLTEWHDRQHGVESRAVDV